MSTTLEATPETVQPSGSKSKVDELRRLLYGAGEQERFFVNEVDGEEWATNSYWAVPLKGSSPCAQMFQNGRGTYRLGTSKTAKVVDWSPDGAPNVASVLPDRAKDVDLIPVYVKAGGLEVRAHDRDGCPLFQLADGDVIVSIDLNMLRVMVGAADTKHLNILNGEGTPTSSHLTDWRNVILRSSATRAKGLGPVAVYQVSHYTSAKEGRKTYETFAGVLMPRRQGR